MTVIGVIGAGSCNEEVSRTAEQVGKLVAERKAVLVCGGLGGVMSASAKGAQAAGGLTVGILPGSDRNECNEYISIPVVTGMGHARNAIIANTAQALIAIAGEYGSLSEIALSLKMGKPVVSIGGWSGIDGVIPVKTPEEAVDKVFLILESAYS